MAKSILSLALAALAVVPSTVVAAPSATPDSWQSWNKHVPYYPVVEEWIQNNCPGKYQPQGCTAENMKVRKDFATMAPEERKAYTTAINCLWNQPSKLDQTLYPAAINRYMDYAVVHVNRTKVVHLDGFFLTWHRYYLHLFEQDLAETCGYYGAFPYWNWPATADNLHGSAEFNGDEYSMSSDGYYTNNDPVVLAPGFAIPHGMGGGCIMSGPFKDWVRTMDDISTGIIIQGLPLPPTAFAKNESCLTRDLNTFAAQTWTNYTEVTQAVEAPDLATLDVLLNGVIGGTSLGIHSGAHFIVGSPGSSIFVSVQDPIWWSLHTMLDRVYTSWQARHPDLAQSVFGTMTAVNLPPSDNVTLETVHPDWGYFEQAPLTIGELISTTSGPFCYKYDSNI